MCRIKNKVGKPLPITEWLKLKNEKIIFIARMKSSWTNEELSYFTSVI